MPHCIMGKIHMGAPPPIELDRQTDKHVWNINFSQTTYAGGNEKATLMTAPVCRK